MSERDAEHRAYDDEAEAERNCAGNRDEASDQHERKSRRTGVISLVVIAAILLLLCAAAVIVALQLSN